MAMRKFLQTAAVHQCSAGNTSSPAQRGALPCAYRVVLLLSMQPVCFERAGELVGSHMAASYMHVCSRARQGSCDMSVDYFVHLLV